MKIAEITAVVCFFILFALISGCIEGSFTKTETLLVKLDGEENIRWISVIQNPDYATATGFAPRFYQFIQTSDNGFFVAGYYSNRSGYTMLRVFRTDDKGNPLWDQKRETIGLTEIRSIFQWNDGEYSLLGRGDQVYTFDSAGNLLDTVNMMDSICRTNGTICYDLTPISLTQNSDDSLTGVLINGNFSTSQTTLMTTIVARNGTLLKKEILPLKDPNVAGIIRTNDTGWLLAKGYRDDAPGGGYKIRIEKTNASFGISWDTGLGTCNTTSFCNTELIGMQESGNGYDIIYQSYLQHSNESAPVDTIFAELDTHGNIVRQDKISNLSGLPGWIFLSGGSRTGFYDLIPKDVLEAAANAHGGSNPTFGFVSLVKTADGGYALLGTRYYRS